MALVKKVSEEGAQGTWFVRGHDHGKPVRALIRPVPASVNRTLRGKVYGSVKSRKSGNQSVAQQMEHLEQFTIQRAAYALVNLENWGVEVVDAAAAAQYGTLLGVDAKPGDELFLDGKCSDEVKRQYLADFPIDAGWISEKADSLTRAEIEEEEEATDSF